MSARRQADVEDPAVIAHRERARRAVEGRPSTFIVAATLQEAQGVAFTRPERHVRLVTTTHGSLDRLRGLGQGTTVVVHPSAFQTRYAADLTAVLGPLAAVGVTIEEVKA